MAAKCKVCNQSVYPMDPHINLDGSVFHRACAKCADCKCQITIANFTKNDTGDQTLLLCKTHYFKRFHEGGSYVGGQKFQNKSSGEASKSIATMKVSPKCKVCAKSVYPMDPQINLDGSLFHSQCAKCADCKCQISISNFAKNESGDQTLLLCRTHYFKRFNEAGGSLLGGEKYQVKNARDVNAAGAMAAAAAPVKSAAPVEQAEHVFDFKALSAQKSPAKTASDEPKEVEQSQPETNSQQEEQQPATTTTTAEVVEEVASEAQPEAVEEVASEAQPEAATEEVAPEPAVEESSEAVTQETTETAEEVAVEVTENVTEEVVEEVAEVASEEAPAATEEEQENREEEVTEETDV